MVENPNGASASDRASLAAGFLALHKRGEPLVLANPWDVGSAKLFASLGFQALATTSSGHAYTLGAGDPQGLTADQALANAIAIAAATDLPVTADLENGYADDPAGVAAIVARAAAEGLAGCSIEDFSGNPDAPFYDAALAAERIAAAAEAAHSGPVHLVLTARADKHMHGIRDLDDTIERLVAYEQAGADVVYAPGITDIDDIGRVCSAVDIPVNLLTLPGGPTVAEAAAVGVARISVGGIFGYAAIDGAAAAASELLNEGTLGFLEPAISGMGYARAALATTLR